MNISVTSGHQQVASAGHPVTAPLDFIVPLDRHPRSLYLRLSLPFELANRSRVLTWHSHQLRPFLR